MGTNMGQVIERARKELGNLTGLEVGTTLGASKDEEGGWEILIECVEKHSIPDQMDILGIYDVRLDEAGNLIEFKRKKLRKRIDTDGEV